MDSTRIVFSPAALGGGLPKWSAQHRPTISTIVPVLPQGACRRGGQDLPSDRWVTGLKHLNENRGFLAIRLGNPRNPFSVQKFNFLGASATACGVAPRGLSRLTARGWPPEPPAAPPLAGSCLSASPTASAASASPSSAAALSPAFAGVLRPRLRLLFLRCAC